MLEEQLKAFIEAVNADAGLQEKLKVARDSDAVVTIAKSAGFLITADELTSARAGVSDEELEEVNGGSVPDLNCNQFVSGGNGYAMHLRIPPAIR